jgi:hypothetical protein
MSTKEPSTAVESFGIFHPDNNSRLAGLDLLCGRLIPKGMESPFGETGSKSGEISKYNPSTYKPFYFPMAAPEMSPAAIGCVAAAALAFTMLYSRGVHITDKRTGKRLL